MGLSLWFKLTLLILPLAALIVLEATYQLSQVRDGFGDVPSEGHLHYTWTAIPASVMTLIKLLQISLASTIGFLDPFRILTEGSASAQNTLFQDYLSQISVWRGCKSAAAKSFAVLAVTGSILLAPFLTIVASGLFTDESVPTTMAVNVSLKDRLLSPNKPEPTIVDDIPQAPLSAANVLMTRFMPYPEGTYDNFVYPRLQTLSDISSTFNASSLITEVLALYPDVQCTALNTSDFASRMINDSLQITTPYLGGCDCLLKEGCSSSAPILNVDLIERAEPFSKYHERWLTGSNVWSGNWSDVSQWSPPLVVENITADPPVPYPNITMVYGNWSKESIDIAGAVCTYKVEQVHLNVTYDTSTATVTGISPGLRDEEPNIDYYFPFGSGSHMQSYLLMSNTSMYDSFFMAIMNGSDPSSFLTAANSKTIAERAKYILETFAAQYYNGILRETRGNYTAQAHLVNESRHRLFQNTTSTRILEGLLAGIWICTALAYLFFRSMPLLPANPSSIAAQASLLAGADFLKSVPTDAGMRRDEDLMKTESFTDRLFSLAWWETSDGTSRFGIDAGVPYKLL